MNLPRFSSDRVFRIWDWSVSHCRLLIRSPRSEHNEQEQNIDLAFYGVFYMELRESMNGLTIASPNAEDEAYLRTKTTPDAHSQYYVIESSGMKCFVGAVQLEITENDLPIMQSSLWRPSAIAETKDS